MYWDLIEKVRKTTKAIFPDKKVLMVFFLSLFILISIFSVGFYLNDEMEQATCFYNFLHGYLTIEEVPEHYYVSSGGMYIAPRYVEYGGHKYVAASHGMSVFSVPFYYFLLMMDSVMGMEIFFIILWSFLLAAVTYLSSDYIVKHFWPDEQKRKKLVQIVGITASLILLIVNLLLMKPLSFERWGPPLSMQFMSIVFVSLALSILFRFLRRYFNERIALFGVFLLLFSSPVVFWAIGQKYHGLNFSLLIFSLASFYYGRIKNIEKYHYASYVFASLAVWVQLFSGVVILLSLLLVDILTIKKRRVINILKIVVVILVSLTPYFAENYAIYDNPLYPGYIAKGNKNVIPPQPPKIEVISPSNGECVTGIVEIHYNVSENAEESMIEYKNATGDGWIELNRSKEKEVIFFWNVSSLEDGVKILRIKAWNWRGDVTEKNVSVIVDNTPPSIKIFSPQNGSIVAGECIIWSSVSEDTAYVKYQYSIDGKNWNYIGNDTTPYDGFSWNTSDLQGSYLLKATAYDSIGFNNSTIIKLLIDNTGKNLVLRRPQDGEFVGGKYFIYSVAPPGTTHIAYEYLSEDSWKKLGVDNTPHTPFIWNTSGIAYENMVVKATAYSGDSVIGIDINKNVTVDNREPIIKIVKPLGEEKVESFVMIEYNTSDNIAFVEVDYSKDNKTWQIAGIDLSASYFLLPVENFSGKLFLKAIAFTNTGLQNYDYIAVYVVKERKITFFEKFVFIINSVQVGWNMLKDVSAIGKINEVLINLYKSFFNAKGTDSCFAFFIFVPFLFLSFFSPIAYLKRKQKFGIIDGLMLSYILLQLFFFVNMSTHQGGGYDVRFYLPLHIPFLYFSIVATKELITKNLWDIIKAYLASVIILFPTLTWVIWLTGYKGSYYLIKFDRVLGRAILISLVISFILWVLSKEKIFLRKIGRKHPEVFDKVFATFIGISIFFGTWILILITIIYSRGLPAEYTESGTGFSMIIPLIKALQDVLQSIFRYTYI